MSQNLDADRWARLRFAIIGPLLAAPPAGGELRHALQALAQRHWQHPTTGQPVQFSYPTLERWFYAARRAQDPVAVLRRRRRQDAGRSRQLSPALIQALEQQYHGHPSWSVQLHYDNLSARAQEEPALAPLPSYTTVRRYLKARGLHRQPRPLRRTPGAEQAAQRRAEREVRSFEADYVHGLWHLDFHHGSKPVLTRTGRWVKPRLLGVISNVIARPTGDSPVPYFTGEGIGQVGQSEESLTISRVFSTPMTPCWANCPVHRHNGVCVPQPRRPATVGAVRADGRCSFALQPNSPARTTLPDKPGMRQAWTAVRCTRKAAAASVATAPMSGSTRPAHAFRAGIVHRVIAPSVCWPIALPRGSRARYARSKPSSSRSNRAPVLRRRPVGYDSISSCPGYCAGCACGSGRFSSPSGCSRA